MCITFSVAACLLFQFLFICKIIFLIAVRKLLYHTFDIYRCVHFSAVRFKCRKNIFLQLPFLSVLHILIFCITLQICFQCREFLCKFIISISCLCLLPVHLGNLISHLLQLLQDIRLIPPDLLSHLCRGCLLCRVTPVCLLIFLCYPHFRFFQFFYLQTKLAKLPFMFLITSVLFLKCPQSGFCFLCPFLPDHMQFSDLIYQNISLYCLIRYGKGCHLHNRCCCLIPFFFQTTIQASKLIFFSSE